MVVQGVAWGISVAGWIMSPIISKLLDKVLSYCKFNKQETLHRLLTDVLPRLALTLEATEATNHWVLVERIVKDLKSAFYDIEDILDELEYIRHEKKLNEQKRSPSEQKNKRPKIASDAEAGPSNQDICIEPSLTLTGNLNVRLKDKMNKIEQLIDTAQGMIALANPSSKDETVMAKNTHMRTTSAPTEKVTGRDEERDRIIEMLRDTEDEVNPSLSNNKCFSVIGIHGISGSGKTTLAQHVCKYEEKEGYFDLVMWIHVSQNYSVGDIFKEMFEAASEDKNNSCPQYNSLDVLEKELKKKIEGKRFFLVLDDIWCNKDANTKKLPELLSPLMVGEKGSRILATSRNKDAFADLGPALARTIFPIPDLDDQVFLELFMYYALESTNADASDQIELENIGAEIAQKLKGSPLAARTVGGQLRKKHNNVNFWRTTRDRDLLNETTGAVWWSYQHLDEQVRRCFSYCSIFPRRHRLYRDELVKLWVAEGFIPTTDSDEMEVVGQGYFDDLLATSFLQPGESDYSGELCYLIHDLMHDLAEKVAGNDCFRIENGPRRPVPRDVRHLFVANGAMVTKEILELKNLRTLIIHGLEWSAEAKANGEFFEEVFEKLRKLRVLAIEYTNEEKDEVRVLKIPETIGHLKHLRYFSLAFSDYGSKLILPSTFTNLYHLQVLIYVRSILSEVYELEFPANINMGKLTNLRHIIIAYQEKALPNIARLTSLQTLENFTVSMGNGYEIKQLRDLNKLQGRLCIECLDNVNSKQEACDANLADKTRLTELRLYWNDRTTSPDVQADVLEGLHPPRGLKTLVIWNYFSPRYPSWMVGEQNGPPMYLHTLKLKVCDRLGPARGLFECFIHLREFEVSSSNWESLPDNVKNLRWLKKLMINCCWSFMSLPELPPSLQEFAVYNCSEVFMKSCTQKGHPNCQKLQHVEVKQIGFTHARSSTSEEL